MDEKNNKATDELVKQLRSSLESDQQADGSPDEVFTLHVGKEQEGEDEDIAAFDSYMAKLLSNIISEDDEKTLPPSEIESQPSEPLLENDADEDVSDEALAFPPVEELDEQAEQEAVMASNEAQTSEVLSDEESMPSPDVRAALELPEESESDASENVTLDAEADEQPCLPSEVEDLCEDEARTAELPPFEVLEQLSIDRQEEWMPSESDDADDGMEMAPWEEPREIADEQAHSEQQSDPPTDDDVSVDLVEPTEPLSQKAPSETDREAATEQPSELAPEPEPEPEPEQPTPTALREGDLLLDEEDEVPESAQPQPSEPSRTSAREENDEEGEDVPVPVPSPLDAIRNAAEKQGAAAAAPRPKQSPLDAMAAKVAQGNVSTLSGSSVFGPRKKTEREWTDDDVELLLDLGYEGDLTQKIGGARVEAVRYRRRDDERARKKIKHAYGFVGEEYSGHAQDQDIQTSYRKNTASALIRIFSTTVLVLMLLALDMFPLYRSQLAEWAQALPTSGFYGLPSMLLLVVGAVLMWPLLKKGVRGLLHFEPVPASLPALLLFFTLLYDVVGLFDAECGMLLNVPVAVSFLLLSVGEWMTVKREKMAFDVVSSRSRKIVAEPLSPRKKKVVRDGQIVKIINDEGGKRLWRVHPTDCVASYFRRSCEATPRCRALAVLLPCMLLTAVLVGGLTLFVTGQMRDALSAFVLAIHMTMPASALVSYAYPLLLAVRELYADGCTIIGERSVDEYAGEKTLIFDDTEMFRARSSTEITIKGSGDPKKYVRYAKRLFRTLGGTLRGVSTTDLSEESYEERVEILKVHDRGVEARIDGKVNVLAGTSAFMVKRGIRVPDESAELLVRRNVESSILYLAFDGHLKLGYEIDYRISGRFEQMVAQLGEYDTAVAIESCDPDIHTDYLSKSRRAGQPEVQVVKPVRFERARDSQLCDSGIVATRSARDIAKAAMVCDSIVENDRQMVRFHKVAWLLGTVVVLGLSLFGPLTSTASLIAALLQPVWCIPVVLLSRKNLINEQHSEKKYEQRSREPIKRDR